MVFFGSTLLVLLFAELVLAGRSRLKNKTTLWTYRHPYVFDRETGYKVAAHFHRRSVRTPKNAKSTGITCYDTGANGFRWHNQGAPGGRILVLGDSFTEATDQENSGSFVGLLARRFPHLEFVNTGLGGARSVHLRCLLAKHLPRLNPRVVLIQLSHNDFYDAALGLTRIDDRFTHRLSHSIACSSLENALSRTHVGSAVNRVFLSRKRINLKPEEQFRVLTQNLDNPAWSNLMESCCREMAALGGGAPLLFYVSPHPFMRGPEVAASPQALSEIGIGSCAWYDLFVQYYKRLDAVKDNLARAGLTLWDPNAGLETFDLQERLDLFVDRSHLSSAGHAWFAGVLGDGLETFLAKGAWPWPS